MACRLMGREREVAFYDRAYGRQPRRARNITNERHKEVAPWVVGPSVLDLGCGVALIADMIDDMPYLGIDFSAEAIAASKRCVSNPNARFECASFEEVLDRPAFTFPNAYGTVLLLEVLEHIEDPQPIVDFAIEHCIYRLIVMVPRDMRGPAHVKPSWTPDEIENLLGPLAECYLCGGPDDDWWWLAIHDKVGGK